MRRLRTLLCALFVGLLTLLPATPAWAHATLVQTTPSAAAVLRTSPAEIVLRYDQPVGTTLGSVKVLAPSGARVDTGKLVKRSGGRAVVAALRPDLKPGTYTILWRMVSEDTHAIFGASTFSIGQVSTTKVVASAANGSRSGEYAQDVVRFVAYTGLALLLGGLAFIIVLWPGGAASRLLRRLLWIGLGLSIVATIGGLLAQGPYSDGKPLSAAFSPSLIVDVLHTRFGVAAVIRLALLSGFFVLLTVLRHVGRRALAAVTAALGVGVLASTAAVGHSADGDLVSLTWPADVLHMAAAFVWLGGLAVLMVVVLRRPEVDLASLLPRWSRLAASSVLLLVVTGAFAGWRQVSELGALTGTNYGRLLIMKVALVVLMLVLGAGGRAWIRRRYVLEPVGPTAFGRADATGLEGRTGDNGVTAGGGVPGCDGGAPGDGGGGGGGGTLTLRRKTYSGRGSSVSAPPVQVADHAAPVDPSTTVPFQASVARLRLGVFLEALLAVIVLCATAVLVAMAPARSSYFPVYIKTSPVSNSLRVRVIIFPARVGLDTMHLYYTGPTGRAVDVVKVSARWTEVGGTNVVPVELSRSSAGHYDLERVSLPAVANWQLAVTTQTTDIDSSTTLFTVRIR